MKEAIAWDRLFKNFDTLFSRIYLCSPLLKIASAFMAAASER